MSIGYRCIAQFKRENTRAGGVAIYEKLSISPSSTPHTIKQLNNEQDPIFSEADEFGDICAANILIDGSMMTLYCVYLSPKTSMKHAKAFMARNLFHYREQEVPIIVVGDFNVDVSKEENAGFIQFMNCLELQLVSDPSQPTTLGGSCIDMVFATKNLDLPTKRFVTYFSYHRPLFTLLSAVSLLAIF